MSEHDKIRNYVQKFVQLTEAEEEALRPRLRCSTSKRVSSSCDPALLRGAGFLSSAALEGVPRH
jgi:hypothetical protein